MTKSNLKTKETVVTETVAAVPAKRGVQKVVIKPTDVQIAHLATLTSTSAKIRYLAAEGYVTDANKYSGIANYLGLLTPHVRNVLTQPVKRQA